MSSENKVYRMKLSDLRQDPSNANMGNDRGARMLAYSVDEFGVGRSMVADANGVLSAGNKTQLALLEAGYDEVLVIETDGDIPIVNMRKDWDIEDTDPNNPARMYAHADNRTNQVGFVVSAEIIADEIERGADMSKLFNDFELAEMGIELDRDGSADDDFAEGGDAEPQISRAEQLAIDWGVESGQIWRLPSRTQGHEHRIVCGDCTDSAVLELLMGDDIADLVHADPPYGMGKEKDGVINDNLYREKLDEFQMKWWKACRPFVADNGSAYIWGNAPDLWRLWYVGGLRDSERVTFRSFVTWDKVNASGLYDGNGIGSGLARMFANISEFAMFFMLGEQGFNNNSDNYWEGWEPIRKYLYDQRLKMGWDVPTMKTVVGHSYKSRDHWTSKSQWSFPTRDVYEKMQQAAHGDAFKRDYDDLKRDFYGTRAYFDNTHDNMTDIWAFPRVVGDDRQGHATPKPVAMMERAIKSSCPRNGIVLVPFNGSSPEIIAAENTQRQVRAIELQPQYVAVALQRYMDAFNIEPDLVGMLDD